MGKIITVDSGKSGTGKTTVAAAVSSCIAMLGNKTLCIDFGTGLNNVSCTLGMDDKKYVKKIGVFKKQDWITEACCEHPGISGLFILTMSARFNMSKLCAPDMKLMFKKIRQKFDYCIIDTPPASFPGFKLAHADTDIAIVVTAGDLPIMYDVLMVTQFLHEAEINDVRLLINRVHPDNIEQMKTVVVNLLVKTGAKLTGFITVDDLFSQAGSLQDPQTAQHKQIMNKHFLSVARSLINETGVSDKVTASSLKKPAPIKLPTLPILQKPPIPPIPPIPPKPPMPPKPVLHVAEKNSKTAEPPNPASIESIPANFLGSYGDPTLWAQSTLNHVNIEDLVEIYAVTQGLFVSGEAIRNRIWFHDLLDDNNIPYYIEVGSMGGSKTLVDSQHIFVEKKNAGKAFLLIKKFNENESIVSDDLSTDDVPFISDDGIPQTKCPSCNEHYDFDHPVCPHCKGR